jgi:subtilisin family serine protease
VAIQPQHDCCDCFDAKKDVHTEHRIGGGYLYRPNQLLVHEEDVERVEAALRKQRVDFVDPSRVRDTSQVRFRLRRNAPAVPWLVRALRSCDEDADHALRVAPDHVMVGFGHPLAFPGGPPSEAPALRDLRGDAGCNAKVAILDTGVVSRHAWFAGRAPAGRRDQEEAPNPGSQLGVYAGHGTFIAGVVLQQAPGAKLHIKKAFTGEGGISDTELAQRLADLPHDVDVVNISFGAYTHGDQPLPAVTDAVRSLLQRGRRPVVVAAAGNQGTNRAIWPAALKGVIAVAATDGKRGRARFSSHGPWVDAAALGKDVHSTFFEGELTPAPHHGNPQPQQQFCGFAKWSGTSFAAPWVAGRIAAKMTTNGPGAARTAALAVLADAISTDREIGAILTP